MGEGIDVVVAGAINTDLVAVVERAPEAGETVTGSSFSIFGGGKAANQAVAARRSGASVVLVGAVGDDEFGRDRLAELGDEGIDLVHVAERRGMASGVALITVERDGENRIAYVPGPTLAVTGEQIVEALERARPKVYLQPNEVPLDAAQAALRRARELGAITILNAAPDAASARDLLSDTDYLIVNEVEAFDLAGRSGRFDEIAAELAEDMHTSVVLTAGSDGAYGVHRDETCHEAAPKVDVVDTTGAGDTFCGAFASQVAAGASFEEALRWAVWAASLATTVAGAQPSIPRREAVDAFIAGDR
jgi:ribokinase